MHTPGLKLPEGMRACLFDMDGVLTQTARVHAEAWKEMFDEYLKERADGGEFLPFDIATDYVKYVDGRLREDGVRGFLESRGISIPEGDATDSGEMETVHGLGTRKNDRVQEIIATHGVELYPDALVLLKAVRAAGLKTAVVSASKNTPLVLDVTGIGDLFDYVMHGGVAGEMGLPGKPQPDTFIAAAEALDETPATCVVLEDAISGVQAGRAGHFGYVVGVDRAGQHDELLANGADIVFSNLEELIPSP
jgi:beta-phosphoglucomutase family hydrolase